MSLQSVTDLNPSYSLYSLTWLNSDGVFDKYIVNEFTIPAKEYRNYTIAAIYRPYDEDVDTSSSSEAIDTVQYKSFPVAQTWCVYYYNDILIYEMEKMKYVQYENLASGSVRYTEGFKLYTDKCDSHYVAMKIELIDGEKAYEIEKIYDADITYTVSNWTTTTYLDTGNSFVSPRDGGGTYEKTLTEFDTGSNEGNGLFGKKYTWNRISTVEEFKTSAQEDANEEFSQEELDALNQADFVFRICETDYEISTGLGSQVTKWSSVSNIGLLRLHFLSEGKVYNLGCVGDLVGTDSDPELDVGVGDNILNTLEEDKSWWQKLVALILGGFLLLLCWPLVCSVVKIVFKFVIKGIGFILEAVWNIFTIPIRLIFRRN